jgi:hypothetical protein
MEIDHPDEDAGNDTFAFGLIAAMAYPSPTFPFGYGQVRNTPYIFFQPT